MTKPSIDLGLGNLSEFEPAPDTPRPAPTPVADRQAIDAVGRELGFVKASIPTQVPRRARRNAGEQLHQVNIRGPVSVMARFIAYCDDERIAYWEAIDALLREKGR